MANITELLNISFAASTPPLPSARALSRVEAFEIAATAGLLIDRIVTPIWYIVGVIGNPVTMKIWLSRRMREGNSSAIYIGSIAIAQFIFIFLHIFMELHIAWGVNTYNKPDVCEFFNFLYITPQYLCPLLILGFTVERYIAVCHPFRKEKFCTVRRASATVGALTALTLVLGSVQAFIWTYDHKRRVCFFRPGNRRFIDIWNWASETFIFGVVPLAVLLFNVLVIREINQLTRRASFRMYSHNKDGSPRNSAQQTSTVTLLSVSFYHICTLLPATIVYALQSLIRPGDPTIPPHEWNADPVWHRYLTYYTIRKIVEEICFSNYACYVFIYYATGSSFRKEVHKIFCYKLCKRKLADESTTCSSQPTRSTRATRQDDYTLVASNGKTDIEFTSTAC